MADKQKLEINENRTFGSEFEIGIEHEANHPECEGYMRNRYGLFEYLSHLGFHIHKPEGYHETSSHWTGWKMEQDGSIEGKSDDIEIITPVLRGHDGMKEVEKMLEALNRFGVHVNSTMGVHIHHWVGDFNDRQLKNLYALYQQGQSVINYLQPRSRRNNSFAYPLRKMYNEFVEDEALTRRAMPPSYILPRFCSGHGPAVNFARFVRNGTVEFRQGGATTEYRKWEAWFLFTHAMIEAVKATATIHERQQVTLKQLFTKIGFYSGTQMYSPGEDYKRARNYLKKRYEHFLAEAGGEEHLGSRIEAHLDRVMRTE